MDNEIGSQIVRRLEQLKPLRQPHENVWRECYDYSHPLRGSGFNGEVNDSETAKRKRAELLDSTSTDSARILASSIMGGMTPANSRWFELDSGNETDDEKRWLDSAAQTLWENIHGSNFDAVGFEGALDLVDAGWFCMYIEEDEANGGLAFHLWPISEIFCAASKPGGLIDTVYRTYQLTAEQAIAEFGSDNVSDKIREAAEKKPDEKFDFVHAIYPRKVSAVGARMARNMPVASVNVECKSKKIVRESGYHEMPVVVPRWMQIPRSVYAVGPMFDALPDIKELSEIKRLELASLDIALGGMWIAEDDGVLNAKTIKLGARKVIVASSVDSMKALNSGVNFNVGFTKEEKLQASIRKVLMADQLQPQDGPAMTATEVHVRVGLVRQLLGPVYGRLQAEYLQPLITRCFGLAYRAGVLGRAPDSLAGRAFSVKYISPLARAQKMEDVTSIERLYTNAGMIAQARGGDMSVFDNLDDDQAINVLGDALGVPDKIRRRSDDVAAMRKMKQQAMEEAQKKKQMSDMAQEAGSAMIQQAAA